MHGIIRGRAVVVINFFPLMTECGNASLRHSDPMTPWREDGQGSLFVLLVSEPAYHLIWWEHWWIYLGVKKTYIQI